MTSPGHSFEPQSFQALFAHAERDPAHTEDAFDTATVVLARNSVSALWRAIAIDKSQIPPEPNPTELGELSPVIDDSNQGTSASSSDVPPSEHRKDKNILAIFKIIDNADEIRAMQDIDEFSIRARAEFDLNGSKAERFAGKIISVAMSPLQILKRQKNKPKRSHFPLSKEGEAFNAKVDRLSRPKRAACAAVGGVAVAIVALSSHVVDPPIRYQGAHESVIEEIVDGPSTNDWQNFDADILDALGSLINGAVVFTGIRGRVRIELARQTAKDILGTKMHTSPDIDQETQ